MNRKKNQATPYDDAFRTLFANDLPELVIPLVNEMFGYKDRFTGKEIITKRNSYFLKKKSPVRQSTRITDSMFQIGSFEEIYHLECESTPKNNILIRMFEYDSLAALENYELNNNTVTFRFPVSGILFLRSNRNIQNRYKVILKTPGKDAQYYINVLKIQDYSLEEMFKKRLYILLPFYLFIYSNQELRKINSSQKRMEKLLQEVDLLIQKLSQAAKDDLITQLAFNVIIEMLKKVSCAYTESNKCDNIKVEVERIMGGEVIELESMKIYNEGKTDGSRETEEKMYRLMREKGFSEEQIRELEQSMKKERNY